MGFVCMGFDVLCWFGVCGCVVFGELVYYVCFGFELYGDIVFVGVLVEYFFVLLFDDFVLLLVGDVCYYDVFYFV